MQGLSKSIPLYRFRRHHNRRCVYDMKFCGFCKIVWIVALQIQQDLNHKELTESRVLATLLPAHSITYDGDGVDLVHWQKSKWTISII